MGADGSFYLTPTLNVQGWLAHSFTQGKVGRSGLRGVGAWTSDLWEIFTQYLAVGPETEAKSGFVQREDLRRSDLFLRRTIRPAGSKSGRWTSASVAMSSPASDGTLEDWSLSPIMAAEFESGDQLTIFIQPGENRPDEDFDLADTLDVPRHIRCRWAWSCSTSPTRSVSSEGNLGQGTSTAGPSAPWGAPLAWHPLPKSPWGWA